MNHPAVDVPVMFLGEAASAGIARGQAFLCHCDEVAALPRRRLDDAELSGEIKRLAAALREVDDQFRSLGTKCSCEAGTAEAAIIEAQRQMLHDPELQNEIMNRCLGGKLNIEAAVSDAMQDFIAGFERSDEPAIRERAADLRDVARRLISRLLNHEERGIDEPPEGSIVVIRELPPSLAAGLSRNRISGLVVERGSSTGHTAIMARSLGIPMVIQARDATSMVHEKDPLIVDGLAGRVFVRPSNEIRREYDRLETDLTARRKALTELVDQPAITRDNVAIKLTANVGKVADASAAAGFRAEGIGLYRTEFVFFAHPHFPTEEEQYRLYRAGADLVSPHEVVLRALDIGSDKLLPYFPLPTESNPSLGLRGTRLLLAHEEILRPQLRAMLRVSATHRVSLLFPMISGPDEFRAARGAVEATKGQLRAEHQPFDEHVRVGAMIETPAAVITVRQIAREADFLSVGTNDLVQYLLVADRTSSEMAAYYEPLHPAVIQALKQIVDAAGAEGIGVSLCGEIAGDPAYTELLLGLGVTSLSVAPGGILEIKRLIRSLSMAAARRLAARALEVDSVRGIKACMSHAPTTGTGADASPCRALERWRGECGAGPEFARTRKPDSSTNP